MQSRVLSTYVHSISNQPFIFRVSIRPHIRMGWVAGYYLSGHDESSSPLACT